METKFTTSKEWEDEISSLLDNGQIFTAHDSAKLALQEFPDSMKIRQLYALALMNTGAIEETKVIVRPILESISINGMPFLDVHDSLAYEDDEPNVDDSKPKKDISSLDAETLEFLARIYRDIWKAYGSYRDLCRARDLYKQSFEGSPNTSRGINAASLSWLMKDDELSIELCDKVIKLNEQINPESLGKEKNYIRIVDTARAYLMKDDHDTAIGLFKKAKEVAGDQYSLIVGTLNHLHYLRKGGFEVPKSVFEIISPPKIVVFTGCPIDKSSQEFVIFPPELEHSIKSEITKRLDKMSAQIGYSSAACGSDILFIEAMFERKAEVNIILPYDHEDFIEFNVRYAGARWESRFRDVIQKAKTVSYATDEKYLGHQNLNRFSNEMLHGLAIMRADFLYTKPYLLAVWDPSMPSEIGSSGDFIDHWEDINTLNMIDIGSICEDIMGKKTIFPKPTDTLVYNSQSDEFYMKELKSSSRIIKTMMFTDFANFSKLKEEHIPSFVEFMHSLKDTMNKCDSNPISINTWGDAVFVVMDNATSLAKYALWFREGVKKNSKITHGLPQLNARISLHAGPVFEAIDPFVEKTNYYGSHINRAARLEPVTVAGHVYATHQFIALINTEQHIIREEMQRQNKTYLCPFVYRYVGVISLAKNFGHQPVYHIQWRR
jgi:tetratricopeptide (TPR) repeat protein